MINFLPINFIIVIPLNIGKWTDMVTLLLVRPGTRTVLTFEFEANIQIQIGLLVRCDLGLILVLAELTHFAVAEEETPLLLDRIPPQLIRNIQRSSGLTIALEMIDFMRDVTFLHLLVQQWQWIIHRTL